MGQGTTNGIADAVEEPRLSVDDELVGKLSGDDTAFKIFGGYRFTGNLALEMACVDGGKAGDMFEGVLISERLKAVEASAIFSSSTTERFGMYVNEIVVGISSGHRRSTGPGRGRPRRTLHRVCCGDPDGFFRRPVRLCKKN